MPSRLEDLSPALEVERAAHGLRLRDTQLYLEPIGRPSLGFLAHARGARATLPERTVATPATVALLEAAQPRALRRAAPLPAPYGKPVSIGPLTLTLHPAGYVLGSAQLRCEVGSRVVVYAGDLGGGPRNAKLTAERREQLRCDTLVLRAIYGSPRYRFPPREETLGRIADFVESTLAAGATPVLLAAPVGAAQELVHRLGARGHPLRLHTAAHRAADVYRAQGVALEGFSRFESAVRAGEVVLLPAWVRRDRLSRELGPHRICLLSGLALDEGLAARAHVDLALPLSDHADFDELVEYAVSSGARRVLAVHGHSEELAEALRARGVEAQAIREHHRQLELF